MYIYNIQLFVVGILVFAYVVFVCFLFFYQFFHNQNTKNQTRLKKSDLLKAIWVPVVFKDKAPCAPDPQGLLTARGVFWMFHGDRQPTPNVPPPHHPPKKIRPYQWMVGRLSPFLLGQKVFRGFCIGAMCLLPDADQLEHMECPADW